MKKAVIALAALMLAGALFLGACAARPAQPSTQEMTVTQANAAANDAANENALQAETTTQAPAQNIALERAKEIALQNAGLATSQVTFTKEKLERDDGVWDYDIEFTSDGWKYEYEINAGTGAIRSQDKERTGRQQQAATTKAPGNSGAPGAATDITLERAKEIALQNAGLAASQATFIKAKLEYDDGVREYDIEFTGGGWKYEYEIHAGSGAIRSQDKESIGGHHSGVTNAAADITLKKAKERALKHAGLKAGQVTFTKAKLELDDGVRKYEIEFVCDGYEYEYEIHAGTGAVLEFDKERQD